MLKRATFEAKYLKDGHLSVPKDVVNTLLLRTGEEVRVVIENKIFDRGGSLASLLFGRIRVKGTLIFTGK